jgi:hypothetical protein
MRRFSFGFVIVALPAFALSLMLAGCGGKDTGSSSSSGSGSGESKINEGMAAQQKDLQVLETGKGVLKGKITLKGNPKFDELTKQLQDEMKKKDTEYCMKGSEEEKTEQAYRVSEKGQLGNVFVWVLPVRGTFFKVDDKQLSGLEKKVKVRQPHCAFVPHCLFLFSEYHDNPKKQRDTKPTGQVLEIVNDAKISHNTNWGGGSQNKGDNVMLAEGKDRVVDNLRPEANEVTVKCNIHPWMKGYLRVVDTPYYAISLSDTLDGKDKTQKTDPKFGTYEIKGLPAGKVRVLAWHEDCGYLNEGKGQGEEIEIKADTPTEKDFDATAK